MQEEGKISAKKLRKLERTKESA